MRRLLGTGILAAVCAGWLGLAGSAGAQESPAARATRKKLKQKITVEFKEVRIKDVVDDIKREFDNRLGFKIDNVSGISNNSKVSLTAKDQPLEQILNALCDKYDMGYYVVSNPKEKLDGYIILRKSKWKERGYEEGKEPKQKTSLEPRRPAAAPLPDAVAAAVTAPRWAAAAGRFRPHPALR